MNTYFKKSKYIEVTKIVSVTISVLLLVVLIGCVLLKLPMFVTPILMVKVVSEMILSRFEAVDNKRIEYFHINKYNNQVVLTFAWIMILLILSESIIANVSIIMTIIYGVTKFIMTAIILFVVDDYRFQITVLTTTDLYHKGKRIDRHFIESLNIHTESHKEVTTFQLRCGKRIVLESNV